MFGSGLQAFSLPLWPRRDIDEDIWQGRFGYNASTDFRLL
jgi:hypothetical protein